MRRTPPLVLAILVAIAGSAAATETQWWINDTAEDFLDGAGNGVAITEDGRLEWSPRWIKAVELDEPVLSSAVVRGDNVLIGTGFPAALYAVDDSGLHHLADVPAEQVTAMVAGPDGAVYVATVAPATVMTWDGDKLTTVGEVDIDGLWDVAWFDNGLVAAGGTPARLFRLRKNGLERWVDLPDAHARCLSTDDGRLLVGTSGKGRLFAVDSAGRRNLLADSKFTEIVDIVPDGRGAVWAAAVVGEPETSKATSKARKAQENEDDQPSVVVSSSSALDLPKVNGKTATSELLRITPAGALLRRHRFTDHVVTTLALSGDGVLVGTGFEGEIWWFSKSGGSRLAVVDAVQVGAFTDGGRLALTQGPAQVLRRAGESAGWFRSAPLRLKRPARWGAYRVTGPADKARIRFRSGATKKPDDTWSLWTEWRDATAGEVEAPSGRALQWEIELAPGSCPERVEVAYREHNLAPRITGIEVLKPGEVYLAGAPPSGQIVDVSHPDLNGLFTVLGDETKGNGAASRRKGKRYWRVGYRSVSWKANDPNDDPVRFQLSLEDEHGRSFPVRERLEDTILAVDVTAVPDGLYRFSIHATDEPGNPGSGLESDALSRWFVVDSTQPDLHVERTGDQWTLTATDRGSGVSRAEVAVDGRRWEPLAPDDGLFDGSVETFRVPVPDGATYLVVRAFDHHHNSVTRGISEE